MPGENGMKRRRFAVLQKKLEELESLLRSAVAKTPDASSIHCQLARDEITSRIGFLDNLLAAEMESNADNTPEHLHHIAHRLSILEDSFHNWINLRAPPDDDALSACSCTHSCLNEAEEDEEERDEDGRMLDPDSIVPPASNDDVQGTDEKKQIRYGSRNCGIIGAVMVVVAATAAAVIGAAINFSTVDENVFLVPT